jgi:Flp pilus assembly protein TadB
MTQEGGEPGKPEGQRLDDLLREANEYYEYLKRKHNNQTRLHVALASVVVWFAAFAVLGLGAITTIHQPAVFETLVAAFLAAVVIGAAAGLVMYASRRKRGLKLVELGTMLDKMNQGAALSSESGLRLTDAMHRAALDVKKRSLDSAYEYGIVVFIVVVLVGQNPAVAALAGVVAYLYFRHEALSEYEKEEMKYEDSKKELLQSL